LIDIPDCTSTEDENAPCFDSSTTALCKGSDNLYTSTPASGDGAGSCSTVFSEAGYKKITCSGTTCNIAAESATSFLIYEYKDSAVSQFMKDLYSDDTKLFSCTEGTCVLAPVKYYYLDENNSNLGASEKKLVNVPTTAGTATAATDGFYYLTSTNSNLEDITLIKIDSNAVTALDKTYYYLTSNDCDTITGEMLITIESEAVTTTATGYIYLTEDNSNVEDPTLVKVTDSSGACNIITGSGFYLNPSTDTTNGKTANPILSLAEGEVTPKAATGLTAGTYYLDGDTLVNGKSKKLIECKDEQVTCDYASTVREGYYLNGDVPSEGGLVGALIHCTESGDTLQCEADQNVMEGVYLNNAPTVESEAYSKQIITCTSEGCNTDSTVVAGKYYIDAGSVIASGQAKRDTDPSFSKLIYCEATDKACDPIPNPSVGYYLNATPGENSKLTNALIECIDGNPIGCKVMATAEENLIYLNKDQKDADNKLIKCTTDEGCGAIPGIPTNYYLNGGANKTNSPLIFCDSEGCIERTGDVGIYLDGSTYTKNEEDDTVTYTNLIVCSEGSSNKRTTITCDNPGEVTEGFYVNVAQTGLPDALIECTSSTTPEKRGDNGSSEGPTCSKRIGIDKDFYLNAAESSQLISCTSSECEEVSDDNIVPGTYLDGSTYTVGTPVTYSKLIVCQASEEAPEKRSESGCTSEEATEGIYLNAAQTGLTDALIECTSSTTPEKRGDNVSSEGPTCSKRIGIDKDFYLNAATTSQLITCTSSECEEVSDDNIVPGTYLDGSTYTVGTPVTYSKLIVCPASEEAPEKRSESECTSEDATEGIYVNASETGLTDALISCKTGEGDAVICSKDTGVNKGYYLNVGSDNTDKPLIKCLDNCQSVALKEDADSLVFLNANYKVGKDETNPLIKCPSSDATPAEGGGERKRGDQVGEAEPEAGSSSSCALAESAADTDVPEFYVNGDRINSDEDDDGALKTDIIKCVKNGSSSSKRATTLGFTCSVSSQTTKPDDIFINANFAVSQKQIIKCTSEDGCLEASAFPEETDETPAKKRGEGDAEEDPGASGEASGAVYYVNAGSVKRDKLEDTLIKCASASDACTIEVAAPKQIYINANTNQLILCYESSGCLAKTTNASENNNEFYLNSDDSTPDLENDLIKCYLDENNEKKCEAYTGVDKKVYINSYNTTQLIYCLKGDGCDLKDSAATAERPEYYVNGDDIDFEGSTPEETEERRRGESEGSATDKRPLIGDLIECKVNGSVIKCSVINGHLGDVYINANYDKDETYQIIQCPDTGCVNVAVSEEIDEKLPDYYINSGNKAKDKFAEALIKCSKAGEACEVIEAKANEVYVNSNENQLDKPIIKCAKNSCSAVASAATESSKEYYINAGKASDSPLQYDIIECSVGNGEDPADDATKAKRAEEVTISCSCVEEAKAGVYMNTNYSESGDNNQLIQCTSDNGCVGVRTTSVEYYVNAESSDLANAIIFCSNKKCEKQTPSDINIYYVGKDSDNVNGLIECVETTEAETATEEEKEGTPETDEEEQNGGEPQERKRAAGDTVNKCTLKSAFTSQGYYLNSGYNKSVNQTIICDSTDGCNTVKVDLGYYVNAGNTDKPIIKCEKEGNECVEEASKPCPDPAKAVPGNYCYEDSQLKFFTVNNSTAIAASKSDDTYAFATIPSNGFPGIKSETGALFKISRYFINRFYQSGVIMIDKNGKLVDSLGGDTSDISLYDCNDSTKVCTERPGCTSNTYMFDSENRKAVFCNDGTLEYASFTGYVVDGNRVTSGTKHPYIIHCENGEKCTSFKPKSSTYYENSGYDASTNSLIQCNSNNCMTVVANVGYYVGHGESDNNGVIKCTTATSCTYSQVKNKVKYVNAGYDKRNNAIIECKGGKCNVAKAKSGYYLTHTSTLLIQCTSPTTCAEFTPTVNYYDNADSSESSNTIINCVQNSNVVTCSSEATNNGFYMSSLSNVLIRCKAGHKCKTIVVKNGIFRGALKGLTSNKRSDNVQNVHERDADDDSEEDGKMVNLRDNSDDAYGVIRCVAGKCAALSASELAAIPMCEFNNNKCYITLEYAMTKSATTSIAAGNICTNSDRSVFYFATDTVVVKPNVISGVTSTYVYTTTNSNCLEVNDSYNDMYFTVGSNIYTLDQGSVLQFYETGYYFLNVAKNTLVSGNEIDAYNDENVKLYRCNGSSCSIIDKPDANTYYADVNKRILKYNVNNDVYTFAYEKDVICIFANNKCTPNADLKNQEFCITYKGEIVLATTDIKNRETGECYRAGTINNYIYGYSQHLYHMNQFAAEMVDQTGFYIISLSTNTTVVSKNYKNKNNSIVVYGCNLSSCRVYEPDENTYYYDAQAKNILRYKDGVWSSPSTSGYAYIALNPTTSYIYKFAKKGDEVVIQGKANYGYYYTIDDEMYHCDQEDGECKPIDETGYYFTNAGEIYYCVHDSEGLEITECVKQNCVSGQYYYIDDAYYRCEVSSLLVPVVSRYCSYDDNVVVNFPLALTEEFPDKIKQAVDDIQKNNNSTAVVTRRGKNYLEAVSGIFTNCTYNVEETKSTFDLVCVNNYVAMDKETDEVKICNVDQLGYVECIEDEDNPEKCSISGAYAVLKPSLFTFIILFLIATLFHF